MKSCQRDADWFPIKRRDYTLIFIVFRYFIILQMGTLSKKKIVSHNNDQNNPLMYSNEKTRSPQPWYIICAQFYLTTLFAGVGMMHTNRNTHRLRRRRRLL